MSLFTDSERKRIQELKEGSYYGQIGITIRFNNHFWYEHTGTLVSGACGGDNLPTLLQVRHKKKKNLVPSSATAVLDRCGNNWKNGKGGCGILLHNNYAPCLATMFLPFVMIRDKSDKGKENKNATDKTNTAESRGTKGGAEGV